MKKPIDHDRRRLLADRVRPAHAIPALDGPAEGRRYLKFRAEARSINETWKGPSIRGRRAWRPPAWAA